MVYVTSSARVERLSFDSLGLARQFLASRKLAEETVCIEDIQGNVLFLETYP